MSTEIGPLSRVAFFFLRSICLPTCVLLSQNNIQRRMSLKWMKIYSIHNQMKMLGTDAIKCSWIRLSSEPKFSHLAFYFKNHSNFWNEGFAFWWGNHNFIVNMEHVVLDLECIEFHMMKEVTSLASSEERNGQPKIEYCSRISVIVTMNIISKKLQSCY